jgi:uncharacterized protein YqgC (DUF456 family)
MDWSSFWQSIGDFAVGSVPWLAGIGLLLAFLVSCVGSLIPALPGALFFWIACMLHGLITGFDPLGVVAQLLIFGLWAGAQGAQFAVTAAGAKKYGASNWGIGGAMIGMFFGLFLPIPIAGPFLGAFLGAGALEFYRLQRQESEQAGAEAARAGFGATLGAVMGLLAEFGATLLMGVVVVAAFVF